jgi:hypothetical protein
MAKRTLKDVMEMHGITRDVLNAAKAKGVNVWNDSEMVLHFAGTRHRIAPGAEMSDGADAQSLEQMEDAIRRAKGIDDVKILKEKLAALKIAVQVRTETKELIPVGEARQSMTRCVSAARAELLKMSSDLPPRLAGLGEAQIQKEIREAVVEVLTRLADETNELYQ